MKHKYKLVFDVIQPSTGKKTESLRILEPMIVINLLILKKFLQYSDPSYIESAF